MKKIISLLIAIFVITSVFSGCGDRATSSEVYDPTIKVGDTEGLKLPLTKENITIEWQVTSSDENLNDSWLLQKLRGITGVDIQLNIMPESARDTKIKTLIAGKNIPDIITGGLTDDIISDMTSQGAFACVEDYIDELPNFRKTFVDDQDNNWIFDVYSAVDGKLYGFFGYDWQRDINHTMMYRKDIFDKNNIKMWTTNDEFYQVLKQLKEIYPDSTPYVSKVGDQIFAKWAPGWGIKAHEPYYDEADGKWKYSDIDPKYKDMLDFMKKLYNEGLIDPEFITCTAASWTQKMTQEKKAFVTFDWIDRMTMFKEQTKDTIPEYDLRFANPVGPNQTYAEVSQLVMGYYVKKTEPEKEKVAFRLLDFLLSPAGKELTTMGIEGETFVIGEDGMAKYLEFDGALPSMSDLATKYGMFTSGLYESFDRRSTYFNFAPQLKEAQEFAKNPENIDPLDPVLKLTAEELEKKNEYLADLQKSGKEFAVTYILGNASWDEWVEKAKKAGCDELVKIYNDAQIRLNNK